MKAKKLEQMSEVELRKYVANAEAEAREALEDPNAPASEKAFAKRVLQLLGLDVDKAESEAAAIARGFGLRAQGPGRPTHDGASLTLHHMTPAQARAHVADLEARSKLGLP